MGGVPGLGATRWGYLGKPKNPAYFEKGNRLAAAENMSPEAHQRRMRGLFKSWGVSTRKARGERVMTAKHKKNIQRAQRVRLRENIVKEVREIQEMARKMASTAMRVMEEIMCNEEAPEAARIAAGQVILERGYGKATQTSINAVIDSNGKPSEVTARELDTRVAEALKRVENLTGGAPEAADSKEQPADIRKRDRDPGSSSLH